MKIVPGIKCDGYVLDDGTACLSKRGTADLLGMNQDSFQRVTPKLVKVVAKNSPHKGRKIVIYSAAFIESFIRGYSLALAHRKLRANQVHIGERYVILQSSLVKTALEVAIKEACVLPVNLRKTAQKSYTDIVKLMRKSGLKCSVSDEVVIKTDITDFLDIPLSTLNSFLGKRRNEIEPIRLDRETIRALGSKASRMNGYSNNKAFGFNQ